MKHLVRPNPTSTAIINVTPRSAGWHYLAFQIVDLQAGQSFALAVQGREAALVPLAGTGVVSVGDHQFALARQSVFGQMPHVLYCPPDSALEVTTSTNFQFALGSAPAVGRYPLRLFAPAEMKSEVRGGGSARRQVNHILAHPLPAERLILYEVYVPGGSWSGWPPHCHDGYAGSPYLEETYYFRFDPAEGFAMHRNYRIDRDFDEVLPVGDGDLVLVTQGFHATAAAPNHTMYFLNFLAGELIDETRGTPPSDDPAFAWLKGNWDTNTISLPAVTTL